MYLYVMYELDFRWMVLFSVFIVVVLFKYKNVFVVFSVFFLFD